ncbi:MFS transporter [Zobellia uliginosa]|uniref:MFS transporter n=1 Tax=Zobellia uliginosa TaxID=143224 RepID=UPI00349F8177
MVQNLWVLRLFPSCFRRRVRVGPIAFNCLSSLRFLVLAIAVYALTLAPVFWVLISEIFPNRVREALNKYHTKIIQFLRCVN